MGIRQEVIKALRDEKMAHDWEVEIAMLEQTYISPSKDDKK